MDFSILRHTITILSVDGSATTSFGEHRPNYREYKTIRAYVAPMTGREYQESQKIHTETTYKIRCRYFSGITADMLIRHGNREFNIVSILNVGGMNEELQIIATERDGRGS